MRRLHDHARFHGAYAAGLLSATALALFAARVWHADTLTYLFLPYNLALGAVPMALAGLGALLARGRAWPLALPLLALWLVWLPNSTYLLTDLVHLRSRAGVPHVYDSTLIATFAAAGFTLGLGSMSIVHQAVVRRLGAWPAAALWPPVLLLDGLGVYIGRYLRWNSWDLATAPLAIVRQVGGLVVEPSFHLWASTLTHALVVGVAWLAFASLRPAPRYSPAQRTPIPE